MRYCVTQKQMQEIEKDTIINTGIPSIVLMERAALAVADAAIAYLKGVSFRKESPIYIVCGKGNNGADGIAVARLLFQQEYKVIIVTIGNEEKATSEYKIQSAIARQLGIAFCEWSTWNICEDACIVDGIFGIGLTREITGDYAKLIGKIAESTCAHIIAIDIPSGISADTGEILGCAVRANVTVTFEYEKVGMYLGQGKNYVGDVVLAKIGFDQNSRSRVGCEAKILEESDLAQIPIRREDSNKGTYGKLLVVAGSKGMCGAAYLCAKAAYASGAGLVKVLTVEENRAILQGQLPEAIIQVYNPESMKVLIEEACQWASAIVIGPGLGQDAYVKELVETVMKGCERSEGENIPLVMDSDALNTVAKYPELMGYYGNHVVITPHVKEMSRLTGKSVEEIKEDSVSCCRAYSDAHNITCILKDGTSVISDGGKECYLTISGNSALAKAGTGDVLAGLVVGMQCIGMTPTLAAAFASYMHGRAGSLAAKSLGKHGVVASDLLEYLWMDV